VFNNSSCIPYTKMPQTRSQSNKEVEAKTESSTPDDIVAEMVNDSSVSKKTMISILADEKYKTCTKHAQEWEALNGAEYRSLMCLKPLTTTSKKEVVPAASERLKDKITETLEELETTSQKFLCVLPIGHSGKCTHLPHKSLLKNKGISVKLDWIYSTPGNDDYVYKNRSSRLFPIRISDRVEKILRNKNIKLKCAVPLSESSTPLMLAAAYLDYITLLLNVQGIEDHLNTSHVHLKEIQTIAKKHAKSLSKYYAKFKRRIFDAEGYSICPMLHKRILINDLENVDIKNNSSFQLGHVTPRSESEFTIRGKNLVFMTREGNRILGDHDLRDQDFMLLLKQIAELHLS
jgi:hypothetical protein